MQGQSGNVQISAGRKSGLGRRKEIVISFGVTIVSIIVSFYLAGFFEMLVFGVIAFTGCQVFFSWVKFDDILTEIDDSRTKRITGQRFVDMSRNFERISDRCTNSPASFIVKMYSEKFKIISTALNSIVVGTWFDFDTDIFRRFTDDIFTPAVTPAEKKADYFYGVVCCGEAIDWFITTEGKRYLEYIDRTILAKEQVEISNNLVEKRRIKRIFIYDTLEKMTYKDWICIQLHEKNDYQVRLISADSAEKHFGDKKPDFAIYRKSFVWKKGADISVVKEGKMCVDSTEIECLTKNFDDAWLRVKDDNFTVDETYVNHCGTESITKLHEIIKAYKRKHPEIID